MISISRGVFRLAAVCSLALVLQIAHAEGGGLAKVAWIAGCWERETAETGSAEHWMPPAAGAMFGVGRTVKAGKTVEYEFMRIVAAPDGRLLYIALPSGQSAATFTQLKLTDTEVVFENLQHDFPQRVIYKLAGSRLLASVEGISNGKLRVIEFPMKRVSCDAQTAVAAQ